MSYQEFLDKKRVHTEKSGFDYTAPSFLYPFQRQATEWAIENGRACLFEDCGLGKTPQQLVWADAVREHTGKSVLIVAPLAVSEQTVREGVKFGIDVDYVRAQPEKPGTSIYITNYEMAKHFQPDAFAGIVLDECFAPETKVDIFDIDKAGKRYGKRCVV